AQGRGNFLVVGTGRGAGDVDVVALVAPTGEVLSAKGTRESWGRNQSIEFDGSSYFAVRHDFTGQNISGVSIATDGTVLPPGWSKLFAVDFNGWPVPSQAFARTSLAFNGDVFLVSWTAPIPGYPSPRNVYAARVSQSAELLDPNPRLLWADVGLTI